MYLFVLCTLRTDLGYTVMFGLRFARARDLEISEGWTVHASVFGQGVSGYHVMQGVCSPWRQERLTACTYVFNPGHGVWHDPAAAR